MCAKGRDALQCAAVRTLLLVLLAAHWSLSRLYPYQPLIPPFFISTWVGDHNDQDCRWLVARGGGFDEKPRLFLVKQNPKSLQV